MIMYDLSSAPTQSKYPLVFKKSSGRALNALSYDTWISLVRKVELVGVNSRQNTDF